MPVFPESLLITGSTCWKKMTADRLSLLQDAGPTFSAMASAMEAARHTIFILGWDLDSRTVLRPEESDPSRRTLLALLCRRLQAMPKLHVFVLIWDFSVIFSFEREPQPRRQFGRAHPRLHFAMDSDHGTGGSHHQKIVVIDDQVAFVGGIDLTFHRWDTPEHKLTDERRIDASGNLYDPFHDVHTALAGPAAAALGELWRQRWRRRRRRPIPPPLILPSTSTGAMDGGGLPGAPDDYAWPVGLPVDATNIEVAIARTLVQPGKPTIKEVEAITLAAFAAAERWIYVENQYFTSGVVTRALAQRLMEEVGPEIVLVLPEVESGWKEQSSMGILRAEALAYLQKKDKHQRLRLLFPRVTSGEKSCSVAVHAKVLVVDNRLAKIGSANFSNRSMGLDSECDLIVEGRDGPSSSFVASVRDRLLGEHLGLSQQEIAIRLTGHGSLCRVVDEHPKNSPRALVPTPMTEDAPFDFVVFDGVMVDPPEPWSANMLLERAVPIPFRRRLAQHWLRPGGLVVALLLAWLLLHRWDPDGQQVGTTLRGIASLFVDQPGGIILATLAFALASAVFLPFTLLAAATLSVFGLWPGIVVAWIGGVLGATLSHFLGGRLGPRVVDWIPDRISHSLRQLLTRRAFWSIVFLRLLPVGNFCVFNILAGAIGVPRRSFVFGNMVGLLPGLLGLGVIVDRLLVMLRKPSLTDALFVALFLALLIVLGAWMKRRFASPARTSEPRRG